MILNYSNPQYFDTSKWKRKLAFPLKLHRNHKRNGSATVRAAATEKYVKRNSQPEITSEDLTASQFANITGIKKKRDDENICNKDESDYKSTSSNHPLSIWDTHFWHNNNDRPKHLITSSISEPCISTCLSQPLSRNISQSGTIQKGRFKIIWGMDTEQTKVIITPQINCVEWKRKKNI
ncbi:unnamed protein product [Rhizopus stolonifer]